MMPVLEGEKTHADVIYEQPQNNVWSLRLLSVVCVLALNNIKNDLMRFNDVN